MAGLVEQMVRVAGGEALVDEVVLERGVSLAKGGGEGLRFERLRAYCAVIMQWVADQQDLHFVLAKEARNGFEIGTERGAVECEERARGKAELIGDGQADALVADVECESAKMSHG